MNRNTIFAASFTVVLSILVLPSSFFANQAFAHEDTEIGNVVVAAGWISEPPLAGQTNGIELSITREGSPVTNALTEAEISIKKGGLTKQLEFEPGEKQGTYEAVLIPTQTGAYSLIIKGKVANQTIDNEIVVAVEAVDDVRGIMFPEPGAGSGDQQALDRLAQQLTGVISDLTSEVEESRTAAENAEKLAQESIKSSEELKASADRAYIFSMVGVGLGVAGIAIAAIALSRRA